MLSISQIQFDIYFFLNSLTQFNKCDQIHNCGLFLDEAGVQDGMADTVGITVGAWASVLEVALLGVGNATWNAHAGATVGDAPAEFVDGGGFQTADQTTLVVLSSAGVVRLDVLGVLLGQLLDGGLDGFDAVFLSHGLGGEVAVTSGTVPVALHGLGVEGDDDAVVLSDAPQQVAGDPDVVGALHA